MNRLNVWAHEKVAAGSFPASRPEQLASSTRPQRKGSSSGPARSSKMPQAVHWGVLAGYPVVDVFTAVCAARTQKSALLTAPSKGA